MLWLDGQKKRKHGNYVAPSTTKAASTAKLRETNFFFARQPRHPMSSQRWPLMCEGQTIWSMTCKTRRCHFKRIDFGPRKPPVDRRRGKGARSRAAAPFSRARCVRPLSTGEYRIDLRLAPWSVSGPPVDDPSTTDAMSTPATRGSMKNGPTVKPRSGFRTTRSIFHQASASLR